MNEEIKKFNEFRTGEDGTYFYYDDKNNVEQWSYNLDDLKNYITNLQEENQKLKEQLNCKEYFSSTMPENTEFVILTKNNYDRQQKDLTLENIELKQENQKLNKIIEDIDKYIHIFKIEDIGEKTMLILNDILLIKNGLGKDVVRLNKLIELKKEMK